MLSVKQVAVNINFKVVGLTRLGIKPESTAQETDAVYHSAVWAVEISYIIIFSRVIACRESRYHVKRIGKRGLMRVLFPLSRFNKSSFISEVKTIHDKSKLTPRLIFFVITVKSIMD